MPEVELLSFSYTLAERPPGRWPFRRYGYELWHGSRLEGAGWRLTERDAARAVRVHASRVGHRLFGLKPPQQDPRKIPPFLPGSVVQVRDGTLAFTLRPLHLEE